ncbi:tetratricopeptide repeat protein [Kerstersia similis]|uniref:tetratricopeptide repeat protein n=1 Tax=Kerstersia similis TaxID=206505 RepID=UPI0039EF5F4B
MKSLKVVKFVTVALFQGSAALLCAAQADRLPGSDAQIRDRLDEQPVEVIRLRAGELPEVTLSADILYRILASEIGAQRGVFDISSRTMLGLARDTGDPRLARRSLEFALANGNMRGALDAARYWSRLAPNDPEASATELALAAAAGQTSGLGEALRERIDKAQDKAEAIGQAVGVLSRVSDRRMALRVLESALEGRARHVPESHLALSDVAFTAGEYQRALDEAKAAQAYPALREEGALRRLQYGIVVDPDQAVADTRAFVKTHPAARNVRLMLASYLSERGDYDAALEEVRDMAHLAPEDFELIYIQAQLNYRAGRLDQADSLLQQFVGVQAQRQEAVAPGASDAGEALADARLLRAAIAEDQGRLDDAIMELGRIDDPAMRFPARLRQASLRAKQGNLDEALAMLQSVEPMDEDERMQQVMLGVQLLRGAGRHEEAVTLLREVEAEMPDSTDIKYELAMALEPLNRIGEMEQLLREVIELDPSYAHAYNALGYTFAERNIRLSEARELIERAHELLPDNPYILDSMGWVRYRQGDALEALTYLQRAYAQSQEVEISVHLGEVLWALGRRGEARAMWRAAAARDADNELLRDTLKRLGVKL